MATEQTRRESKLKSDSIYKLTIRSAKFFVVTSVGDNLDRSYKAGNRYHDGDSLDVMLIIFIAQLEYRVFKLHCNEVRKLNPTPR
jgi:hypothetical protein